MIIHNEYGQGSVAWLEARAGLVTASEADAIISPTYKVRDSKGIDAYVSRKLAEKWGGPLPQPKVFAMEQGNILEDEAIPFYAFEFGVKVERIALITTDDGRAGCSPDGVLVKGSSKQGLECKCPSSPVHVAYLLAGQVPEEYRAQVHFSLWVSGFPSWEFVSYRRQFPPLIITVEPETKAQEAIGTALELFYAKFDASWARLVELNGGKEPAKREPMRFADDIAAGRTTEYDPNANEIIP